jgi:hypothetical protein
VLVRALPVEFAPPLYGCVSSAANSATLIERSALYHPHSLANFGLEATHQGWRVSLWLQAVASGVLLLGAPFLPETPRWLLSQGRTNEAVTALVAVRPNLVGERARAMIGEIKRSLDDEAVGSDASWSGLLVWPKRYRLLLGMGVMIG